MATITSTSIVTEVMPQLTLIGIVLAVIIFLVIWPMVAFLWTNSVAIGQVLIFITGLWVASKFLDGRR